MNGSPVVTNRDQARMHATRRRWLNQMHASRERRRWLRRIWASIRGLRPRGVRAGLKAWLDREIVLS